MLDTKKESDKEVEVKGIPFIYHEEYEDMVSEFVIAGNPGPFSRGVMVKAKM